MRKMCGFDRARRSAQPAVIPARMPAIRQLADGIAVLRRGSERTDGGLDQRPYRAFPFGTRQATPPHACAVAIGWLPG